jgi:hypothetical protein
MRPADDSRLVQRAFQLHVQHGILLLERRHLHATTHHVNLYHTSHIKSRHPSAGQHSCTGACKQACTRERREPCSRRIARPAASNTCSTVVVPEPFGLLGPMRTTPPGTPLACCSSCSFCPASVVSCCSMSRMRAAEPSSACAAQQPSRAVRPRARHCMPAAQDVGRAKGAERSSKHGGASRAVRPRFRRGRRGGPCVQAHP